MHGQPVFIIAQPASPYVWVNFATPLNDTVQVVDSRTHKVVKSIAPGPAVLHMEFAPRGAEVWISVRDVEQGADLRHPQLPSRSARLKPRARPASSSRRAHTARGYEHDAAPRSSRPAAARRIPARSAAGSRGPSQPWPIRSAPAEAEVIARLSALQEAGLVTRVGATVRPNTADASTLAATRGARTTGSRRWLQSSAMSQASTIPICARTSGTCGSWPPRPRAGELAGSLERIAQANGPARSRPAAAPPVQHRSGLPPHGPARGVAQQGPARSGCNSSRSDRPHPSGHGRGAGADAPPLRTAWQNA